MLNTYQLEISTKHIYIYIQLILICVKLYSNILYYILYKHT